MVLGETEPLRRAIGLCARSAVAWKAAYMLALEPDAERRFIDRCTARYALLERLLGLLVERSTSALHVRDLLDGIDMDPARYQGRFSEALADARHGDAGLAALAATALLPPLDECLANQDFIEPVPVVSTVAPPVATIGMRAIAQPSI